VSLTLYFFLYPAGHFGLIAVTFLVVLPLMQEIVVFFETTDGLSTDLEVVLFGGSVSSFTRKVGALKVKLSVLSLIHSESVLSDEVETTLVPDSEITLMVAKAGDELKP
jgi:hypothetical protein